ncbi:10293_t:CDS:2, partial [Funneliformis mosseae]
MATDIASKLGSFTASQSFENRDVVYGLVHFKSHSKAGLFFHAMHDKIFTGLLINIFKFSDAKKFRSNEFVQYSTEGQERDVNQVFTITRVDTSQLAAVTDDNENNLIMKSNWTPTTDFYVTKNSFIINMELPAVQYKIKEVMIREETGVVKASEALLTCPNGIEILLIDVG